jgi:hypothetical protein
MGSVYLDQFAQELAAVARLVSTRRTLDTRDPDPSFDKPFPQGLAANPNTVNLNELFVGQLGTEVAIPLTYELHCVRLDVIAQFPIAGPTTLP